MSSILLKISQIDDLIKKMRHAKKNYFRRIFYILRPFKNDQKKSEISVIFKSKNDYNFFNNQDI